MQDNLDNHNGLIFSIIGVVILFAAIVIKYFEGEVGQKITISSNCEISKTDTIYTKESRWYYKGDSAQRPLRVTLMQEKGRVPYDVVYIEADDYLDAELHEGYNLVHIRTVEGPYIHRIHRIYQVGEPTKIPKPKFDLFKRFRE